MSKFIDEVKASLTSKRVARYEPLSSNITREYDFVHACDVYKIGVKWERDIVLSDSLTKSVLPQDVLKLALKNVVCELRLSVYDDFEFKLIELQRAIIQGDSTKALGLVADLFREVRG